MLALGLGRRRPQSRAPTPVKQGTAPAAMVQTGGGDSLLRRAAKRTY